MVGVVGAEVYVRRDVSRLLCVNSHRSLVRVQGLHCDISPCLHSPKQQWSLCLCPEATLPLAPDLSVCLRLFMSGE